MFIEYGVNEHNELVYIDQVLRGVTSLQCPYCGGQLLARKGKMLVHHFAHVGQTCAAAERDDAAISLPCFDKFNLHLSGKELQQLKDWAASRDQPLRQPSRGTFLDRLGFIQFNHWAGRGGDWELTHKGKIPLGQLSLMLFCQFQEPLIVEQHEILESLVKLTLDSRHRDRAVHLQQALVDLRLYRAAWRRILMHSLYFLNINDGELYKIGVTVRSIEQRVAEVITDLKPYLGTVKVDVLDMWQARGNVELYFKHRYHPYNAPQGSLTEYYRFEDVKKVLLDLRRMKKKELTPLEAGVLAGEPAPIEQLIYAKDVEQRRRQAISSGMKRAVKLGKMIGRPKGSVEALEEMIAKYPSVARNLQQGASLRETAAICRVSINTVRKVRAAMESTNQSAHDRL